MINEALGAHRQIKKTGHALDDWPKSRHSLNQKTRQVADTRSGDLQPGRDQWAIHRQNNFALTDQQVLKLIRFRFRPVTCFLPTKLSRFEILATQQPDSLIAEFRTFEGKSNVQSTNLFNRRPCPSRWNLRQLALIGLGRLLVAGLSVGCAALGEDAGEQLVGGFVAAAIAAGEVGLGGDQRAGTGRRQHRRPVADQVALGPLKGGHRGVEFGQALVEGGDDALLLLHRWNRNLDRRDFLQWQMLNRCLAESWKPSPSFYPVLESCL